MESFYLLRLELTLLRHLITVTLCMGTITLHLQGLDHSCYRC